MTHVSPERAAALDPTNPNYPSDPVELVVQLVEDGETIYGEQWRQIDEDLAFGLDLEHYRTQTGPQQRTEWLVQPTTLQLYNHTRHKIAELAKVEPTLDCRPVEWPGDAESAEWSRWAIEQEIHDPRKRYRARKRTMIVGGVIARCWGMKLDFDHRVGPWGELLFGNVDPADFIVPAGTIDIHDPRCPWVIELEDWRLQDVWAMEGPVEEGGGGWRDTAQVRGRSASEPARRRYGGHGDGRVNLRGGYGDPHPGGQRWVRIAKLWLRFDDTVTTEHRYRQLEEHERYFECPACQRDLEPLDVVLARDAAGAAYPACPDCGGPLDLVDSEEIIEQRPAYPDGRLVIVALDEPDARGRGRGVLLYDDGWPFPYRSFPYWFFRPYDHPRKWISQGDVSLNWSLQVMDNAVLRLGYEQMIRNMDIIFAPREGLLNARGEPFEFTDAPGQIAYFTDPVAATHTKHFQGSGLPPAWGILQQAIEAKFLANVGTSQIGIGPERSRDIPVGTIRTMVRQGAVPEEDHISVLQEDEGLFLGCVLDAIRHGAWPAERWVRTLGRRGDYVMRLLRAAALPQVDVFVTGTPRIHNLRSEDFQLFMQWAALGASDPAAQEVGAQLLNIPPTTLQAYFAARARYDAGGAAGPAPGPAAEPGGSADEDAPAPAGLGANGSIGINGNGGIE